MRGVNSIDQNVILNCCDIHFTYILLHMANLLNVWAYMINSRTKKWWWPLFRFIVDVAVNNANQIYHQSHLYPGEYRLDALGFR